MRIREEFSIFWDELRLGQKALIVVAAAVLIVAGLSGWFSSMVAWSEYRRAESEASKANADAAEKMKKAAAIAADLKRREDALAKDEELLNEKYQELVSARRASGDAQRDYDRARAEPRTDEPDADALCRELAALGYPCQ